MFSRGNRPKILQRLPVYIASKSENHFRDFQDCLGHNPCEIYIEKGFSSIKEKEEACRLAGSIPVYFLSQYRFSSILEKFLKYNETICGIKYIWNVDQHAAQEWLYHIVSIDNYIKNTNNNLFIEDYGIYDIDALSQVQIIKSQERSCKIEIETNSADYIIELGMTNKLYRNHLVVESQDSEDCLDKQLSSIINGNREKLERL